MGGRAFEVFNVAKIIDSPAHRTSRAEAADGSSSPDAATRSAGGSGRINTSKQWGFRLKLPCVELYYDANDIHVRNLYPTQDSQFIICDHRAI